MEENDPKVDANLWKNVVHSEKIEKQVANKKRNSKI